MLSQRDQLSPSQWAVHLPDPTKVDLGSRKEKIEPAEHKPSLAGARLNSSQCRLCLAPTKHTVQVVVAAPVLRGMHITKISTMFDSFDNLFAIHTYRFLCQGASKSVRLERWKVEAVVGTALKKSL